jgi:hypothetical protein
MSYGNNGIKLAQGNLNSATFNAMFGTAQVLVPAPGAGLVNVVMGTFFNVKVGSTTWAGDIGNIWLVYGTTGNDQVNLATPFLTNQVQSMSASTNYVFGGPGGGIGSDWLGSTTGNIVKVLSSNAINKAISITCGNSITSGGNGNVDYVVWYATVKCA